MTTIRALWPVYLAAPVMLTGIQVLLPALPLMQQELGLSDAQIALVTSVYLLPSVIAAVPAGLLADRFGRRIVLSGSMMVFGLGGAYLTISHESFTQLLVVRAIQGAASVGVMATTITIIGDRLSGPEQVSAQGYRSAAMKIGDGLFPVLGGVLAGIAWWAPFTAQLITIPVAIVAWAGLKGLEKPRPPLGLQRGKAVRQKLREPPIIALQAAGFLRFFFKLALITYLPILAVAEGTATASTIGIVLAVAAVAATASGPAAGWLTQRVLPSRLVGAMLAIISASIAAMAINPELAVLVIGGVAFGLADGVYGTLIAGTITQVVPGGLRATFVGVSAAVRNAGKFAAPTLIGLLVLVLPLRVAFGVIAGMAALATLTAFPMRRFDALLQHPGQVPTFGGEV